VFVWHGYRLLHQPGFAAGEGNAQRSGGCNGSRTLPCCDGLLYFRAYRLIAVVVKLCLNENLGGMDIGRDLDVGEDGIVHRHQRNVIVDSGRPAILLKVCAFGDVGGQHSRMGADANDHCIFFSPMNGIGGIEGRGSEAGIVFAELDPV
jgi:hypothetical protein